MSSDFQLARHQAEAYESFTATFMEGSAQLLVDVARAIIGDAVGWVETASDALPFGDRTFTHIICQQGFQFFPDPARAMTEARRVLRPAALTPTGRHELALAMEARMEPYAAEGGSHHIPFG